MPKSLCILALIGASSFSVLALAASPCDPALEGAAPDAGNARSVVEKRAAQWITEKRCVSCHTVLPYALGRVPSARNATRAADGVRAAETINAYIGGRIDGWESRRAWYMSKREESDSTELILSAYILGSFESSRAVPKSGRVTRALTLLGQYQQEDGSFPWLDYGLQPLESEEAKPFGAALAATAYARVKGAERAPFQGSIDRLRAYLKNEWNGPDATDFSKLAVVWGHARLRGVLRESNVRAFFDGLSAKQHEDGGWSMEKISNWEKQGNSPYVGPASDPFATAYVLYVMHEAGLNHDPRYAESFGRGVRWLLASQRESGEWTGVSLNSAGSYNQRLAGDLASGFAWAVISGR